jgi:hypothetical protein
MPALSVFFTTATQHPVQPTPLARAAARRDLET